MRGFGFAPKCERNEHSQVVASLVLQYLASVERLSVQDKSLKHNQGKGLIG